MSLYRIFYSENWPDCLCCSCVWLPACSICSVQLDAASIKTDTSAMCCSMSGAIKPLMIQQQISRIILCGHPSPYAFGIQCYPCSKESFQLYNKCLCMGKGPSPKWRSWRTWLVWTEPWPQPHHLSDELEHQLKARSYNPKISGRPHYCFCGWMGENPCNLVPKCCGKHSQKSGCWYSRILNSMVFKWEV